MDVHASFEAQVIDGSPTTLHAKRCEEVFPKQNYFPLFW